ncbi:GMC oxidoreductase-like protein [Immersiella caudata]|uniref:GMC oxidoreductase-like protein n=1 Tax=Immersiella caudata TaxID=314043 RepID=A0AA39WW40_9PEZI|nr:GMC oxidoreductase-like protein [Immersiella caudata]
MTLFAAILVSFAGLVAGGAHFEAKRQVSQLRDTYDFVIVGGGTCGLTVADRLTEAFPNKTVLVIEYGRVEYAPGAFDPPQTVWGGSNPNQASTWRFQSLPNPNVNDKVATVLAGKVVGGSSAVNGMYFDRPSRFDHDAWDRAGSPEFDASKIKWNWDSIFPFFKKSVTFHEPQPEFVKKYGYTWDTAAFGNSTPIHSVLPPFLWGDHAIVREAWKEMGIPVLRECAGGDKTGLCWIPISEHPLTARRSHAGLGHYADVNATRPNYDLLVQHQVTKVTYPNGLEEGPPTVEVRSLADNRMFNVTPKAEVILSAGAIFTPSILHRSGIGPASVLRDAGIPLVLDLPGVGSNFQDHSGPTITWNYTLPETLPDPTPDKMLDTAFAAQALKDFDAIPARGPYTLGMASSGIYLSMATLSPNGATTIVNKIRNLVASNNSASYLPPDYRSSPSMIAGYNAQLLTLAGFFANPSAPSLEVPWHTGLFLRLFLLHPLSRGTVRLNKADPLEQPIIDYRSSSNPIDMDIDILHTRYMRKIINTPTFQKLGAVETGPGPLAQTDEQLAEFVKDSYTLSFMHPCCTAAMLPENKGGVVGPDLKVHGANGLRVVDMSVLPLLPSAHLSALAYAVGEKAADIIIQEWS